MKSKDLANLLEVPPSTISDILNKKKKINMDIAKKLYQKLGVDPKILLA